MKNIWKTLKIIGLWIISFVGIILALVVFFDSSQITAKIFAAFLFIISIYILPIISKLLKLKIKKTYIILAFLTGFIGSMIIYGNEPEGNINESTFYGTTDNLNVRKGEGKEFDVAFQIDKGDAVNVISKGDNWSEIECSKGKGFVANEFISKANPNEDDNFEWIAYVIVAIIGLFSLFSKKSGSNSTTKTKSVITQKTTKKEEFICKYCGKKEDSIFHLTAHNCSNSPNGKHVVFEGGIQEKYVCEYCGKIESSIFHLTAHNCSNSPTGKHQPFEGGIKAQYTCKHCGKKESSVFHLTAHNCGSSPTGKHHPAK